MYKAVERHMQTFHHREKKKLPSFLDWFGWCTWDAFYTDVTAEGVEDGLRSLSEGGTPPSFLIIDDGWQQIENKEKDTNCVVQEGAQFATRLVGIKENAKFQKSDQKDTQVSGLKSVVDNAKQRHNVKQIYALHALAGYWGGVKSAASGMEHYDRNRNRNQKPNQSQISVYYGLLFCDTEPNRNRRKPNRNNFGFI